MSLPRYPEYKDSGVAWIGQLPMHWEVLGARRLFDECRDAASPDDEQLSATQRYGVIPQRLFMEAEDQKVVLALAGTSNFKRVRKDDFVISLRSFQGGIEHSNYEGCVSPAYTVLRPSRAVASKYWSYMLKSVPYISALQTVSAGIRDGKNISYGQFGSLEVPVPPLDEQRAIAQLLDLETAKIDGLIAEQEKLLALLAEKRQATISHAVTRGLDPDAPMKDSGILWLGKVPAHWSVGPLKHWVDLKSGGTPSKEKLQYWGGDIPWASAKDLKTEKLADTVDHITPAAVDDGAVALLPPGAVLVVVRGMILARLFPVAQTLVPMAINQDLKGVLPRAGLDAGFLAWLLRGTAKESLQRLDEAGHGTKALRMEAWTSMALPIPPETEQAQIVAFLVQRTNQLDVLGYEASSAIELLRERRSALIAAAVTGQIDVRNLVEVQAA